MTTEPIRLDEVLAELERLQARTMDGPAGFTVRELAHRLNITVGSAGTKLRKWFDDGLIEYAGQRDIRSMSGGRSHAPVYRLVKGATDGRTRQHTSESSHPS